MLSLHCSHTQTCGQQLFPRCDPSPSSCTLCYWVLGRALCSVLRVGVTVPYRTVPEKKKTLWRDSSPCLVLATSRPGRPGWDAASARRTYAPQSRCQAEREQQPKQHRFNFKKQISTATTRPGDFFHFLSKMVGFTSQFWKVELGFGGHLSGLSGALRGVLSVKC